MLVRCLYASRPAAPIDRQGLDEILAQCRKNNPRLGVTGLLCVTDNLFIQVLEGGRDEVCELYNAIAGDERHRQVRLLTYEEITERRFGSWTMGQVSIDKLNPSLLLKYFTRMELNPFECSGHSTMALLGEMIETASITARTD